MNVAVIKKWIADNNPNGHAKLAVAANVSPATVTNLVNGHSPTLEIARRVADAIGISLDTLSENQDEDPPAA